MKCPQCQFDIPDDTRFCSHCGVPLHPSEEISVSHTKTIKTTLRDLAPGSTFAEKYQISKELGRGGMGVVYKAEDTTLKRTVALKFLPQGLTLDPEAKERFIREAQAAAALDHPNICTVYEVGEADEKTFIAMAYVEGQSLKEKIEKGPLDLDEVLEIAVQIAEGLEEARKKAIIHRDIKSANIMVSEKDQVKIMDFGLAKVRGGALVTKEGTTLGTVAYMSPEQARGEEVDHRTDIWSFGVVLYEMISGQLPFKGESDQVVIYSILNEKAKSLKDLRPDIPEDLEHIIVRSLEKDRMKRFQSASEVLQHLDRLRGERAVAKAKAIDLKALLRILKKPRIVIPVLLFFLIFVVAMFMVYQRRVNLKHSKALLPQIEKLAEAKRYFQAYDLAVKVEKYLKDDPSLKQLMPVISDKFSIFTQPKGAQVYMKRFVPDEQGIFPDREYIGVTPISDLRVPRVDHMVYLEKEGYVSVERLASSGLYRVETAIGVPLGSKIEVQLLKTEKIPDNMVFVPGGKYKLVGWGLPTNVEVQLDDYFIDKYEVNNEQFKAFIKAGGYLKREYWKYPFIKAGKKLSWEEAMQLFKDRSGLPGPRSWINQDFPEGKGGHPVFEITWYEAAAYAEFAGKSLPTIFQWEKAARGGAFTHLDGVVMPWGLMNFGEASEYRANFAGNGTEAVNRNEFGISPFGCYNMAGNVKEWCLNETTGGYATTGGSWEDPPYMFAEYGVFPGFYSSNALGFRCVRRTSETGVDQGAKKINLEVRIPAYSPVDDMTFKSFLSHYQYDKRPLDARVLETKETADWTREKVTFAGMNDDRIIAYLYLPKQAAKPYQCLNYIPGGAVFYGRTIPRTAEWVLAPQIKSGRAVLAVVSKGATEREREPGYVWPELNTVRYREEGVLYVREFSLGLDYLATRDDIDMDKIAYVGVSWGAWLGTICASVDSRYASVILIGGGFPKSNLRKFPEVNPINFAPHIKAPTLLLNGRYDEVFPWETVALPMYNLLTEPKQLALHEGGHVLPLEVRVPIINKWLDETLRPVKYK